jgi:hypothetical protein
MKLSRQVLAVFILGFADWFAVFISLNSNSFCPQAYEHYQQNRKLTEGIVDLETIKYFPDVAAEKLNK